MFNVDEVENQTVCGSIQKWPTTTKMAMTVESSDHRLRSSETLTATAHRTYLSKKR